ncbi:MAG: succinylglutamate desuccinylase [bacterium]|nr:succinylglutamate desuccinylase [bacterium]
MTARPGRLVAGSALLALAAVVALLSGREFRAHHAPDPVFPSPALTGIRSLGDYNPGLTDTPGDSEVYLFTGGQPGGTLLVLSGTHADEIAGVVAAVLMVENLDVQAGRVIVVPRANASSATHTRPREGHPSHIEVPTPGGIRRFRYGARFTNPVHQRPDPLVFRHPASSRVRGGHEARNLNRVYPGARTGTLTERVAWAIVELIRSEQVDIAFDLHEASPDRDLVNTIVASNNGADLAATATILLQLQGLDYGLEVSPEEFRGLSHREWPDATGTRAFLTETGNPVQGYLRGRTSTDLAVTGRDDWYLRAERMGLLAMPYDEQGIPLETRVGRHLEGIRAILETFNSEAEARPIRIEGLPRVADLERDGLGGWLVAP